MESFAVIHQVAESRIKSTMKPTKSENRIIKHNLEKSKQLIISEENDQEEDDDNGPRGFESPSPEPEICQVDGIPVHFGPNSGSSVEQQLGLDEYDKEQCFKQEKERRLQSPEYVGQDIIYHVFYQDNPLDIIESLLVARGSYDSSTNLEDYEKVEKAEEGSVQSLHEADNLSTQESATAEKERRSRTKETNDGLLEEITEKRQENLTTSAPHRNNFRASWSALPAALTKQEKRIRSLALAKVNPKIPEQDVLVEQEGDTDRRCRKVLDADENQGGQHSDRETTISWNVSSPEAENMEQSLLQLLHARLHALSSSKLKYLLEILDKLESEDFEIVAHPEEHPTQGNANVCQDHTLSLRILSTWGDKKFVGLVQVVLFDKNGNKIDVQPTQVSSNCEYKSGLSRLVDGIKSSNEKDVWEGPLSSSGSPLEIHFRLPSEDTMVGHLEIWNHDQNTTRGVKEVKILVDGEIMWEGTVSKSSAYDLRTRISLRTSSPNLELEASRQTSVSPEVDDTIVTQGAANTLLSLDTGTTMKRIETESLWSRAARYLQLGLTGKRSEDACDSEFNLKAAVDKLDDSIDEIERIINSDFEDSSAFFSKYEQKAKLLSAEKIGGNSAADASYEMFSIEKTPDEAELLRAIKYAEENGPQDSPELDTDDQQISQLVTPSDFCIPLLPRGTKLTIDIHSSWGDLHYVGLSGLEIFDDSGELVHINAQKQITINYTTAALLSGLYCSPCPAERLVDNVNLTCDDSHMWLAPFSPGHPCCIAISLEQPTTLGMIRIWNYNKSTMHTYRGARLIQMFLDSKMVFSGELQRASGLLSDAFKNAEPILFTTNEATLSRIEMHDMETCTKEESLEADELDALSDRGSEIDGYGVPLQNLVFKLPVPSLQDKRIGQSLHDRAGSDKAPVGRVLRLNLLRSWGDCYYFGLTGIQARTFHQNTHYLRINFLFWTTMETRIQLRVN